SLRRLSQRLPDHRHLLSFPTRRSSDLVNMLASTEGAAPTTNGTNMFLLEKGDVEIYFQHGDRERVGGLAALGPYGACFLVRDVRSEEHTSELQSRVDLVCRLLLEKTKL